MYQNEIVTLVRDCEATVIPFGDRTILKKGEQARITQSLGGSITLLVGGNLFRIEGKDADAIGKKPLSLHDLKNAYSDNAQTAEFQESTVWDVMKTCYDPEIPINIVDLGLIYSCDHKELPEGGVRVDVKMTLTAPGCGMGGILSEEVKSKIAGVSGVREVEVELVWEPPWNREMISESARLQLGML